MEPVLVVENLTKHFREASHHVFAVNDVSFSIEAGEILGLVGESGCGKTTIARCIAKLTEPTTGKIFFKGSDVTHLTESEFRPFRRSLQMIFQDPTLSLNPHFTVRRTLSEPLRLHSLAKNRKKLEDKLDETLSLVGLERTHLNKYPHQLSGGQKQRVGIARAIITRPEFVVLDEPTSSLDMAIRTYVIELLRQLQQELGMTYLFISHDLSTIRYLCNRIIIMYVGAIVETGPVDEIFAKPQHPYTTSLLSAIPIPDPSIKKQRIVLPGETPSLTALPAKCVFETRCMEAEPLCRQQRPQMEKVGEGHWVACFKAQGEIKQHSARTVLKERRLSWRKLDHGSC